MSSRLWASRDRIAAASRGASNQRLRKMQLALEVFPAGASSQYQRAAKRQSKHQARAVAPMKPHTWGVSCRSSHTSSSSHGSAHSRSPRFSAQSPLVQCA